MAVGDEHKNSKRDLQNYFIVEYRYWFFLYDCCYDDKVWTALESQYMGWISGGFF